MLKEALLKAGVVTSDDVERVERQQRIEAEEERKKKHLSETRQLIEALPTQLREAIKQLRKDQPKLFTNALLQKLVMAKGRPWILMEPDVIEAMSHITVESMRQDFRKLAESGELEKIKRGIDDGSIKTITIDTISAQDKSNGKMQKV